MLSENIQAKISKSVVNKVSCLTKVDEMHSRYDDNKVADRREFLSEVGLQTKKIKISERTQALYDPGSTTLTDILSLSSLMSSLSCRISTVKVKSGLVPDPSLCVLQRPCKTM